MPAFQNLGHILPKTIGDFDSLRSLRLLVLSNIVFHFFSLFILRLSNSGEVNVIRHILTSCLYYYRIYTYSRIPGLKLLFFRYCKSSRSLQIIEESLANFHFHNLLTLQYNVLIYNVGGTPSHVCVVNRPRVPRKLPSVLCCHC